MDKDAAKFIKSMITKPVIAFVAGATAPPGRRMGHAGAIITGVANKASEKMKALETVGVTVVKNPAEIGLAVKQALQRIREQKG